MRPQQHNISNTHTFMEENMTTENTCPDCGVAVGHPHINKCALEQCSVCGDHRSTCECENHDPVSSAWTGEWPTWMSKRDCKWLQNALRVKQMGIHNVPKETRLHRWLLRQRRLYRQHLKSQNGFVRDCSEEA